MLLTSKNKEILKAFRDGQKSWNDYFESGFNKRFDIKNKFSKNDNRELWEQWNRGWNTNFKGV